MKEQFVIYKIALKLKELGFDEPCFGYYTIMKDWMISTDPKYNTDPHFIGPNWCTEDMKMRFMYVVNSFGDRDSTVKNSGFTKAIHNIAVPLWQQCIDWFREKHDIHIVITVNPYSELNEVNGYKIYTNVNTILTCVSNQEIQTWTHYKAREQAILKCIELCKR